MSAKSFFQSKVDRTKYILFVALVLVGCSKHEESSNEPPPVAAPETLVECNTRMHAKFVEASDAQINWYSSHTAVLPDTSQRARLELGTNGKAVMLLHGFISSPAYMQDLAAPLIKAGFTVYSPLLTGYGTDAVAANAGTADDWRHSIEDGVTLLKTCYPEVEVVAHSLAGALITDEIQNRKLEGVSKLVLLAPYYKTQGSWVSLLYKYLGSRIEAITLDDFRRLTGNLDPYQYLPLTRPLPGAPELFLPIVALGRVLELQDGFSTPAREKVMIPTLVVVSEADGVIDSNFAIQYVNGNFANAKFVTYEMSQNVPHSLQRRDSNPYFDKLAENLLQHLM